VAAPPGVKIESEIVVDYRASKYWRAGKLALSRPCHSLPAIDIVARSKRHLTGDGPDFLRHAVFP